MAWTLRLRFEVLEEFASLRALGDRQTGVLVEAWLSDRIARRRRREGWLREPKEPPSREERAAGRRAYRKARATIARATVPEPIVARPGVSTVCCVACRCEVEIREGCRDPVPHEPCSPRRAGSKLGRRL